MILKPIMLKTEINRHASHGHKLQSQLKGVQPVTLFQIYKCRENDSEDHWGHEEEGNLLISLTGSLWEETLSASDGHYSEMRSPDPYLFKANHSHPFIRRTLKYMLYILKVHAGRQNIAMEDGLVCSIVPYLHTFSPERYLIGFS